MQERKVAVCFLKFKNKILLVKRSRKVSTYPKLWGAISGSIEENEKPLERAKKEIEEETGLKKSDMKLLKKGKPFVYIDRNIKIKWIIHPFLFKIRTDKIKLDWEHENMEWIRPENLKRYKTVPKLNESLRRVLLRT
ncbi:MAG: NUDIX pyrophosphatase [Candidatus Aenigmatarchaeota archaeon]